MENISDKISELINSPGGMEKIRAAASALLGSGGSEPETNQSASLPDLSALMSPAAGEGPDLSGLLSNASVMGSIMKIMNAMNSMKHDSRIDLIRALKPYLSSERAKRADQAISFLKIAAILPLLKEEGLLNLFGEGLR